MHGKLVQQVARGDVLWGSMAPGGAAGAGDDISGPSLCAAVLASVTESQVYPGFFCCPVPPN